MSQVYKPVMKKVLYLNSANATKTTTSGGKNYTFSWNIPEIIINELGLMQVASITALNATTTNIYTFRINNLNAYNNNNISSDGGTPIIFANFLNNQNNIFYQNFGVYLFPQSFSTITIQVSDDYTNKDAGVTSTVNFIIALLISDTQFELAEIHNPMMDAVQEVKSKLKNFHRIT